MLDLLSVDGSVTDASTTTVVTARTGTIGTCNNTATSAIVRTMLVITTETVGVAAIDDDNASAVVVPKSTTCLDFGNSSDRKTKGRVIVPIRFRWLWFA